MDRRVRKTKEAIRTAYIDLLKEKPNTKITVSEIARRADVDRKTIYLHYETIEDIMKELSGECVQDLIVLLKETEFFDRPIRLDLLFTCIQKLLEQDMELFRILAMHPSYSFFWEDLQKIGEDALVRVYETKVNVTLEELRFYARFMCTGLMAFYRDWLCGDSSIDLETIGRGVVRMATKGLMDIFIEE